MLGFTVWTFVFLGVVVGFGGAAVVFFVVGFGGLPGTFTVLGFTV